MITELLSILSSRPTSPSEAGSPVLLKIKTQCSRLPKQQHHNHLLLDKLLVHYLFQSLCSDTHSSTALDDLLYPLHSPAYRCQQLGKLPVMLTRLQYYARQPRSLKEICEHLRLEKQHQRYAVLLANQPPFSNAHPLVENFDEATSMPGRQQGLMLIAASLIRSICIDGDDQAELALFHHGIIHAHIAGQLVTAPGRDPFRAFLTACSRLLSMVMTRRLLKDNGIKEKHLQQDDIALLLPRLDYWIAKDLGLAEDILHTLRQRLEHENHSHEHWLEKAEHAALAFMLFEHGQFSEKQLLQFLNAMSLQEFNLPQQLINTTH